MLARPCRPGPGGHGCPPRGALRRHRPSAQVEDWDLAAALEASARAAAVKGDFDAAERYEAEAREACSAVADAQDRAVVEKDLASLPRRP